MKNTLKKVLFKLFDFVLKCFFEYLEQQTEIEQTETPKTEKTSSNRKKTAKKANQIIDEETGEVLNLDSDIIEGLKRVKNLKNKQK